MALVGATSRKGGEAARFGEERPPLGAERLQDGGALARRTRDPDATRARLGAPAGTRATSPSRGYWFGRQRNKLLRQWRRSNNSGTK